RPDLQPIDSVVVGLRQMRRGTMADMNAIGVEQQDRAADPRRDLINGKRDLLEYFREIYARGNQSENLGLGTAQHLLALAHRNVALHRDPVGMPAVIVADRLDVQLQPELLALAGIVDQLGMDRLA